MGDDDPQLRILVTGAGGPGTVNLCRSLLSMEKTPWIVGVDASPHYVYLGLAHERALVPRCDDRDAYLREIVRLIGHHQIDVVMPNNSLEMAVLTEAREHIEATLFVPSLETQVTANNKWASYEVWKRAGIPVPDTRRLHSEKDVHAAFGALQAEEDAPVWVRGAGIPGRGIGVASLPCRNVTQAISWIDYWRGWGGMIASEFLPGDNLTWMGLFEGGALITSQGRRRLAYVIPHVSPSGITGAPAISETIHDSEVNRIGEAAVLVLDPAYTGVGFVDMKGDTHGAPQVTELNAGRFGTTHYFYTAAGANFPEMLLMTAMGQRPDVPRQDVLAAGLVWIRTLDAGPVLTTRATIDAGHLPRLEDEDARWPRVAQQWGDFAAIPDPLWDEKS